MAIFNSYVSFSWWLQPLGIKTPSTMSCTVVCMRHKNWTEASAFGARTAFGRRPLLWPASCMSNLCKLRFAMSLSLESPPFFLTCDSGALWPARSTLTRILVISMQEGHTVVCIDWLHRHTQIFFLYVIMYLAMCRCNLIYLMNTSVLSEWCIYYMSTSQKSQTYRSDYSNTTNTTSNHSSPPISDQGSKSCTSTPETFQTGASPAMALGRTVDVRPTGCNGSGHTTNQNGKSSIWKTVQKRLNHLFTHLFTNLFT